MQQCSGGRARAASAFSVDDPMKKQIVTRKSLQKIANFFDDITVFYVILGLLLI